MSARRSLSKAHLLSAVSFVVLLPATAFAEQAAPRAPQQDAATQVDEVVVTGRSLGELGRASPVPVQLLAGEELAHRRQGGLGETLAGLPGVHLDNFGGGASRPVIRGQTTPRIEILSDGANLFDASSVSPDHAITTDPLLLDGIEILRGPAAARFGGNAVNGAINLIDSKVPKVLPEGGLTGAVEARYGTGDEEQALAGRLTVGVGPFAFHVEGSHHDSEDYRVPRDFGYNRLRDSFAEGSSYGVGASWITSKGYIGAAYSWQDSEYGLPGHSHINGVCHTHGIDLHCEAHDEFDDPFGSSDDHTAYIKLSSERADIRADYDDLLPGVSHARLRLSYTDYQHDEVDGPALFSRYANEVYDGRFELTHRPLWGFTGTFGVQYTDGTFSGINVTTLHKGGYVPDYVTENVGVFLNERRTFGALDIEISARKDWRTVDIPMIPYLDTISPELRALFERYPEALQYSLDLHATNWARFNPSAEHEPFSASIGATWNLNDGYSAALSLAHTERAPSVREIYAYGNNLATNSYEVGLSQTRRAASAFPVSTTDVMETAQSVNLTFRKVGGPFEFEVGLFHQDIEDYIFANFIETSIETGTPHHYLVYTAADVTFTGLDGQISRQVTPEARVTVFGDYVRAELKNADDNLPRIPPGRLGARYEWASGPASVDLEYSRTFEQDRVAAYETRTSGYNMINATVAYNFDIGADRSVEVYLRGSNLANELAFAHTSFVKDQSPLRGRNLVLGVRHRF